MPRRLPIKSAWRRWRHPLKVEVSISDHLRIVEGARFTRLTVIRLSDRRYSGGRAYECRCDCGDRVLARPIDLRNGRIKSCGCYQKDNLVKQNRSRLVDLTGRRFGRWTVLPQYKSIGAGIHRTTRWKCRCDCGVEKWVQPVSLKSGKSTSCGCSRRDRCSPKFNKENDEISKRTN